MESLSGRVIRSGLWVMALSVTARLLGTLHLLVLARLLTPYDFGLVGISLVMISLFESVSMTGTNLALIQRQERARDFFDTAWTLGLIRGVVMAGLMLALAPAAGTFFDSPDAVAIIRAMALVPLIRVLTNIGVVEFRTELTFAPHYRLFLSGAVADLCVAVPLALWHAGAWALVAGWLASTAVRVVVSYGIHPYRPTLRLDRAEVKELAGYGRWILGSAAIRWLIANGVHATVGRLLGVQALGLYQMAWRVAYLPSTEITEAISGVTVTAYAKLQDSMARVRLAYLRVLITVALAATPIAVGVGVYGADLVRVVLGPRWGGIVAIVQVLVVAGLFRSIGATTGPIFQGLDRPWLQTFVAVVELGILAALLVPLTLWMGPAGTALAATIGGVVGTTVALWRVSRLLGIRVGELAPILGWPLLACLAFTLPRVWLLGPLDTLIGLAGSLALSAILYLATLALLDRLALYDLSPVVPPAMGRWFPRRIR